MTEGSNDLQQGVPFLKDPPFIGRLFRRTVSTKVEMEMVMLLTPVILDSERTAVWTEEAERSLGKKF